jgi:hypothetical protein
MDSAVCQPVSQDDADRFAMGSSVGKTMIADAAVLADIRQQWAAVKTLCQHSHRQYAAGTMFINETPPADYYNLPFVLAFAVLDQVLKELKDQGLFSVSGQRPPLGTKMTASKPCLPWQDYDLVERGKDSRNELAHKAKLLTKAECLRHIAVIEKELMAWGVV